MSKIHISGYGSMLYFIYRSTFITFLLPMLATFHTDGIWIAVIGSIIGFFILHLFMKIAKKNKYDNIIIGLQNTFPKGIGFFLNTAIAFLILYFSIHLFTNLTLFTGHEYLKGTSYIVISIIFLITVIYIGVKDIETVTRASLIFFMISLCMLFIKFGGLWSQIDLSNLLPTLTKPVPSILWGSIKYAIVGILPLFMLLLINPKEITPTKKIEQKTKWFYLLTSTILLLNVFLILTVLGPRLLPLYNYPEFHLLRNVKLLGFMDKLESLLSIQWIIDMIICISICFIYIKTYCTYYINQVLHKFKAKASQ